LSSRSGGGSSAVGSHVGSSSGGGNVGGGVVGDSGVIVVTSRGLAEDAGIGDGDDVSITITSNGSTGGGGGSGSGSDSDDFDACVDSLRKSLHTDGVGGVDDSKTSQSPPRSKPPPLNIPADDDGTVKHSGYVTALRELHASLANLPSDGVGSLT
jgi:hypothetical protein